VGQIIDLHGTMKPLELNSFAYLSDSQRYLQFCTYFQGQIQEGSDCSAKQGPTNLGAHIPTIFCRTHIQGHC